jgi:hypothetical protein
MSAALKRTPWDDFPSGGSRSFGAKNNDPLEVFVFVSLFERLSQPEWGVRGKPQRAGKKTLFMDEIPQ